MGEDVQENKTLNFADSLDSEFLDFSEQKNSSDFKSFSAFSLPISRKVFFKRLGAFSLLTFAALRLKALSIKGIDYISISRVAKRFGMSYKTLEAKKRQAVYSKSISLEFTVHKRDISIAGRKVWLGFPIAEADGMLYVSESDFEKTLSPILFPNIENKIVPLAHIVIDPGHGGKDVGALNTKLNTNEKTTVLDISHKLAAILRTRNYKVTLTRTTDVFVDLHSRPVLANKWGADMFLSIHCNAASPVVDGVETFALTPAGQSSTNVATNLGDKSACTGNKYDAWNALLAFYIQGEISAATASPDRGVKRARFAVLTDINCPAVLIETGFISNMPEGKRLMSNDYRQKLAKSIADGVTRYQNTIDRLRGR